MSSFQAKAVEPCKKPTKRNVLSEIARLFDPLHLLAPFTVRAKILMQDLWAGGCDWDEIINEELSIRWGKWLSEIPDLSTLGFPRCLRLPDPTDVQLHVFSDASKHAYGFPVRRLPPPPPHFTTCCVEEPFSATQSHLDIKT